MTLVEGEELQRLWTLVSELSMQLSANQQLCQQLQAQADELKGQALHTGTGYSLRRFNLDISKEKFEIELEKTNAQLVVENQTLAHENKQMNVLLREYESTLDTIMAKFRSFSHATQQHTLALTSHYETTLSNSAYDVARDDLRANTAFSEQLTHLGSLVRLALREVEGEGSTEIDNDDDDDDAREHKDQDPFETEGYRVGTPSGVGPAHSLSEAIATSTSHGGAGHKPSRQAKQPYGSHDARDPRWHGTGGYTGMQGDPDAGVAGAALEARIEEERLRKENEMLRDLLRVSADLTPEVAQAIGIAMPSAASVAAEEQAWNSSKLKLGKPRGSRKSQGDTSTSAVSAAAQSDKARQIAEERDLESNAGPEAVARPSAASPVSPARPTPASTQLSQYIMSGAFLSGGTRKAMDVPRPTNTGVDHVTQGAGGPPQLSHRSSKQEDDEVPADRGSAEEEAANAEHDEEPVTADIADELNSEWSEELKASPASPAKATASVTAAPAEAKPIDVPSSPARESEAKRAEAIEETEQTLNKISEASSAEPDLTEDTQKSEQGEVKEKEASS